MADGTPASAQTTVVCVGAVITRGERVLLVRQALGHSLAGQWTIPWGRLEAGESPAAAAAREVKEEADVEVEVLGLLGVQELPMPWQGWFALIYRCRAGDEEARGDGIETDAAKYFSLHELLALHEPIEAWSAWLVQRVLRGESALITTSAGNPFAGSVGFV